MKPSQSGDPIDLRRRAEERLRKRAATVAGPQSPADAQRLLHELQVHQIELELQFEELHDASAKVAAALARYTDLYDFAPTGYFTLGRDGTMRQTNLAGAHLLGLERSSLMGRRFGEFVARSTLPAFNAFLAQVSAGGPRPTCEVELECRGRPPRTVAIVATRSAVGDECYAEMEDITERKLAEARLQLFASAFSHAGEGIAITDAGGAIINVNESFVRITGYQLEEILGQNLAILGYGLHGPGFPAVNRQELGEGAQWSGEVRIRRKSGEIYPAMLTISAVRNPSGETQNYVALFSNIESIMNRQQDLEYIAHHDALTGLPNRVLLTDRLRQAMAQCERHKQSLAVAYLDLDGFKTVNDTYGHSVGDDLLIGVAQRMKAALREGDTLSRIGGDEFVAMLVGLPDSQDCVAVLDRLLQAAADPITIGVATLQISVSIGVALYPQDGADADQLMLQADQAMYMAKHSGKNRYHWFITEANALTAAKY